jgi:integrase
LDTTAAAALEFLILTASRTGEVIDLPWTEIGDLDAPKPTWRIPASRMKMSRDHTVPLSNRAVEILRKQLAKRSTSGFGDHPMVFEGARPREGLSQMSLLMMIRRLGVPVTAHGFRAAFRSWCADHAVAFEVAESALAHTSDSVVKAYQRSDMLERRRPVMAAWSDFVTGKTAASAEVVPIRRAAE